LSTLQEVQGFMDDQATIGARLRVLRRWRGMTLTEVAGLAGVTPAWLSRVERGLRPLDRRSYITAIASALRVSEIDLVGGPHLSEDPVQAEPHAGIPALRVALETNTLWCPTVERARPLQDVAVDAERLESFSHAADYIQLGSPLARVLDELHWHVANPADEAVQRRALEMLIEACMRARAMAYNLGYPTLAQLAAIRAGEAAAVLDDPIQQGKANWMRIMCMPKAGSWNRTLIAAERAAESLEPYVRDAEDLQVLGMLTLAAALSAAAVLKTQVADQWLGEAAELAARVPDDPANNWQLFSTTNVNMWGVTIGVEVGQTGSAILEKASMVGPNQAAVGPNRHAAFLADVGRGLAREKATYGQAVQWLHRAESTAPQLIRNNASARHAVEVLLTQSIAAAGGRELRGMAARMGIQH
jgi:transcriptional regulator with XRE-family HTH domain